MSAKTRVLIVDDEPPARERLRALLQAEETAEVVGECATGREAVERIRELKPGLVFLDIQMPELDGFGVVEELGPDTPPIIFVTAYDQYAVKAFEVHAVDYLLKPFDKERFQKALQRAIEHAQRPTEGGLNRQLSALLAELRPAPTKAADRLAIKTPNRVLFLRVDEVDWVEASGNYVILHAGADSHTMRDTMSSIEARLPTGKFMRISRSTIVNIDRIKELQPMFHGDYAVILRGGARLTLSRGYRDKVESLLGRDSLT